MLFDWITLKEGITSEMLPVFWISNGARKGLEYLSSVVVSFTAIAPHKGEMTPLPETPADKAFSHTEGLPMFETSVKVFGINTCFRRAYSLRPFRYSHP